MRVHDLPFAVFLAKTVRGAEPERHFGAVRLRAGHVRQRRGEGDVVARRHHQIALFQADRAFPGCEPGFDLSPRFFRRAAFVLQAAARGRRRVSPRRHAPVADQRSWRDAPWRDPR